MKFPKEQINDETCELLTAFAACRISTRRPSKASNAAVGLCNWAEAMVNVSRGGKGGWTRRSSCSAPPRRSSEGGNEGEGRRRGALAEVQGKLDDMQAKFDAAMAEKQRLEDDAAATQRKMDSATALITALAGEEVRWTEQSKQFDLQIQRLTGDCAMASSFVSYLGPFNKEFRDLLCTRDFTAISPSTGIPVTENLDVTDSL